MIAAARRLAGRGRRLRTRCSRAQRACSRCSVSRVAAAAALRDGPRARAAPGEARRHAARRRRARRGRRRAGRLGSRIGRLAAADRRQRHERVPAARARADRLRGRRRGRAPARADAARSGPSRPPRPDRASAGSGVARPQPGPRGDRGDVPGREPRPRALRVTYRSTLLRGQHDEASFAVPASFVLSEDLNQLIPVLHGAPLDRLPRADDPGAAPLGQRAVGDDVLVPRAASRRARRPSAAGARTSLRSRSPTLAAAIAPQPLGRTAHDRAAGWAAVHAAGHGPGRRRRRARHLPLAARRLRVRHARPDERPASNRPARAHPVQSAQRSPSSGSTS